MLVTFALITHNQERFIREAVRSALAQNYQPLEILISDDHSTDATADIIRQEIEGYNGSHTIRLITHNRDVGWENWSRAAEAARGEFVVCAHGDDVSYPDRTRCLVEAWRGTNASLLGSNAEIIDEKSRLMNFVNDPKSEPQWLYAAEIAERGYHSCMHGATLAWHADVFRSFAALTGSRLGAAYDHVLPFRAALLNGSYYVAKPLVRWRVHGKNSGNEKSDGTRGRLASFETGCAYDLGARICMLDDLEYLLDRDIKVNDAKALEKTLIKKIIGLARDFTFSRNELIANGSRPTWITKAEMEGRADYSKGYFDTREFGPRLIPRTLRQLIARIVK